MKCRLYGVKCKACRLYSVKCGDCEGAGERKCSMRFGAGLLCATDVTEYVNELRPLRR